MCNRVPGVPRPALPCHALAHVSVDRDLRGVVCGVCADSFSLTDEREAAARKTREEAHCLGCSSCRTGVVLRVKTTGNVWTWEQLHVSSVDTKDGTLKKKKKNQSLELVFSTDTVVAVASSFSSLRREKHIYFFVFLPPRRRRWLR